MKRSKIAVRAGAAVFAAAIAGLVLGGESAVRAAPDIAPAQTAGMRTLPNSVILRGEPYSALMRRLPVVRQLSLPELRTSPRATVAGLRVNFAPLLQNPKALANIATRLSALSQDVRLLDAETQIVEVEPGIIVRDYLKYRILPGRCKDTASRAQLVEAGASCFVQSSRQDLVAAFANPRDSRFIADPRRRATAVAEFERRFDQQSAQIAGHISSFHRALSDPQQRNALVNRLGAAEVARIERLSDDELKEELINSGQHRIEQIYFIPKIEALPNGPPNGPQLNRMRIVPASLTDSKIRGFGKLNPPPLPPARFEAKADLKSIAKTNGPIYYLTGFTYGRNYEWRHRVETTVDWCIVGCSETYYVELYAGFDYGFGLRFPIQATLTSNYVRHGNNKSEANVKLEFMPINGTVAQFQATGLDQSQLFDAKELVAQFDVGAGVNLRLPIIGTQSLSFGIGKDFTDGLSPPFTGGHFTPPAPGHDLKLTHTFTDIDLLGGLANYYVAGAKVMPAMQVDLHSDALRFTLVDNLEKTQMPVASSGQTMPISVQGSLKRSSDFSFGNPVYNLGFNFTPGLDAQLFINVEVWSDHWDWFIWFPQLAIQLPPGGADFTCHDGTNCLPEFKMDWESIPVAEAKVPVPGPANADGAAAHPSNAGGTNVGPPGAAQPSGRSFVPALRALRQNGGSR